MEGGVAIACGRTGFHRWYRLVKCIPFSGHQKYIQHVIAVLNHATIATWHISLFTARQARHVPCLSLSANAKDICNIINRSS